MDQKVLRFLRAKVIEYTEKMGRYDIDAYIKDIYSNEGSSNNTDLNFIFSFFHYRLNELFEYLNKRIVNGHYNAEPSRTLLETIEQIDECKTFLKNSPYAFEITRHYQSALDKSKDFLEPSGGSRIPDGFEPISIEKYEPLFRICTHIEIKHNEDILAKTKLIGTGSYAKVYKYKDMFYDKFFAIKRADKNLNGKEIERFKNEFTFMKSLNSPYIVEVYKYFDDNSYTMEYVDYSLFDFINKNNSRMVMKDRIAIINQLLKAFTYLEDQKVLHRDISYTNVLIKDYGQIKVVKLSDFGLVKQENSTLTTINTEFKGSLNDPRLVIEGFSNYNVLHETYALTRLILYVLTGKQNPEKIINNVIRSFFDKGTSSDNTERYQSITHLNDNFRDLANKLLSKL